ncbi:MAG: polyprenyl synthetase family protein [Ignavibacteria bacterium]|nr:polyprenyl synthetase family protein [Ignavibacteria bacterium]
MDYERTYARYKALVDDYLKLFCRQTKPRSLYEPLRYVVAGGGKRIRSVLVLLSCEAVGGSVQSALHAAGGIEILHNFTLVHDDIMDNARSRRGRATVHTKWDSNVAILVGDELLALAYRAVLQTQSPRIQEITKVFTQGVVEVCEGQAYDKEFETRSDVTVNDYMLMIEKKTAKMVSVSSEIGALIGEGTRASVSALRRYGGYVGRAFQIQDDLLDIVADEEKFGKAVGGDLVEGKRTFLLLEALRRAKGADKALLQAVVTNKGAPRRLIAEYRRIYYETGVIDAALRRVKQDIARAKEELNHLPPSGARATLAWFTDMLLNRTY